MLDTRVQFSRSRLLAIHGAVFTFVQRVVPSQIQTLETETFQLSIVTGLLSSGNNIPNLV